MTKNLVWFRSDLRIDDNPALYHAMINGQATLAVYFYCPQQLTQHNVGANHQALLAEAVDNLHQQLAKINVELWIIPVDLYQKIPSLLAKLCDQLSITDCYFNIEYPVNERRRDLAVVNELAAKVNCHRFNDQTLVPPWTITNAEGQGYKVFSAFAKQVRRQLDEQPLVILNKPNTQLKTLKQNFSQKHIRDIPFIQQLPRMTSPLKQSQSIKEADLFEQLHCFIQQKVSDYSEARNFPVIEGTSNLSAAFAVGAISVKRCFDVAGKLGEASVSWQNELIWRDFYRSVVWHFPRVVKGFAFNLVDQQIRWSQSTEDFRLWAEAKTGVPIIDAAMRQLVTTGWMHNRLRMIVASYLTKNLWIDWRTGERFFAQHLFDYDFASNNGGWQWCASVGTDAAPYFRVFNPASQQQRFDPDASFIKAWLPELADFSAKQIHQFETKPLAGYWPLQVNLKESRKAAIESFKQAKLTQSFLE